MYDEEGIIETKTDRRERRKKNNRKMRVDGAKVRDLEKVIKDKSKKLRQKYVNSETEEVY